MPTTPWVWTGRGSEAYHHTTQLVQRSATDAQQKTFTATDMELRRVLRTTYPRNQARRTRRLPTADRAWGHSGRRLPHELKYLSNYRGKSFKVLLRTHTVPKDQMNLDPTKNSRQRHDGSSFGLSRNSPRGGSLLTLASLHSSVVASSSSFILFLWALPLATSLPELRLQAVDNNWTQCFILGS